MKIAQKLKHLGKIVMFSGFFIHRRVTTKASWHYDFQGTNSGAFTLMAPLYTMPDACCHLLYEENGREKKKIYRVGKAVVFGDDVHHTTQPGALKKPMGFICFTLGRSDMTATEWKNARDYIKSQTGIYKTPSGKVVKSRN